MVKERGRPHEDDIDIGTVISLYIDVEILKDLRVYCKTHGLSMSKAVRQILKEKMDRKNWEGRVIPHLNVTYGHTDKFIHLQPPTLEPYFHRLETVDLSEELDEIENMAIERRYEANRLKQKVGERRKELVKLRRNQQQKIEKEIYDRNPNNWYTT